MLKLILLVFAVKLCDGGDDHRIEKRALLFSYQTVLQFSTGLTVPAVLPRRSINLSLVAQANYNLPYNISKLRPQTVSAREKEKNSFLDITRKKFYTYLVEYLESFGLEGEECLLRSICEIAEYPVHVKERETLLEKVVHFVFTPSLDFSTKARNETTDGTRSFTGKLLRAERLGKEDGNCEKTYSECIISLVDLFTAKYFI